MVYSEKVMTVFDNLHNAGLLKGATVRGEAGKTEIGQMLVLYIKVDNEVVTEAKFKAFGPIPFMAGMEIATELIKGENVEYLSKFKSSQVLKHFGKENDFEEVDLSLYEKVMQSAYIQYMKKVEKEKAKNAK